MNPNFVVIGLPSSGKTTFLAALWHMMEADEVDCRLRVDRCVGDLTYLNSIAESWRTFTKVPRTSQIGDQTVAIDFVDNRTNAKGRATFPDLAGETFDIQVETRRCRISFVESFHSDDGIMLFISVDSKQDGLSIVELNSMLPPGADIESTSEEADTQPLSQVAPLQAAEAQPLEWVPKKIPSQVRIVQLLSDILRDPFTLRQRRVAIILSAWDVVEAMNLTPQQWLAANMPLVDQFLKTNSADFVAQVYGVSAQGVSLDDARAVDQVANMIPSQRVSIINGAGRSHDITVPLMWLTSPT